MSRSDRRRWARDAFTSQRLAGDHGLSRVHGKRDEMRITDGRSTATSQLSIERQAKADRLVLTLRGELDLGSGPRLRCELLEAESARCDGLVVDLRRLAFMDSAGLHVLLDAHKRARKNGRRFALLRGPREVQRTFELTHTDHLFTFDS